MNATRVQWTPRAHKDWRRLDRPMRVRIFAAIELFAATGRGDVVRLQGENPPALRLRVGDWRVKLVQDRAASEVRVLWVRPRGGAYR